MVGQCTSKNFDGSKNAVGFCRIVSKNNFADMSVATSYLRDDLVSTRLPSSEPGLELLYLSEVCSLDIVLVQV